MKAPVCAAVLLFLVSPMLLAETWVDDFTKEIKAAAKKKNVPGLAFIRVAPNQETRFEFFGKTEKSGTAIDKETVFRLASVSKTFTAVFMAQQVRDKKLTWQNSLQELVPDYKFDNFSDTPILLQHLIGQSTGFIPNAYDNLIEANYKLPRVLKHLEKLDSLCKPGICYTYQNTFFGVLEEYYRLQKTTFAKEITDNIITPLNMPTASVGRKALMASKKWAKPHAAIDKDKWVSVRVKDNYYKYSPAAGVNASAADMEIWLKAMLLEYPEVIDQSMLDTLTETRVKTKRELYRREWRKQLKDAHYGLGWRIYNIDDIEIIYHGGWVQGYRADVAFSPELGVGYALLMNAESNLINEITAKFWKKQIEAYQVAQLATLK
ncbi:serine hydrolase domain-containing protein [Glaciecola sp. MF2-115]|uniref:serine hydrolase domain-containing protein n=1 Tax=Glaciecola sp. MF2-115 TaxID=3384827 RepID=UPI0039A34971